MKTPGRLHQRAAFAVACFAVAACSETPAASYDDAGYDDAGADSGVVFQPKSFDINAIPADIPTVKLEVAASDMALLDADPFGAADVLGTFVDSAGTRYEDVDVNYRGAYRLEYLVRDSEHRNWKIKFPAAQRYRDRREWNFNYEPFLSQKLAYDLMLFAGVPTVRARHVLLLVNDVPHGLYLEYEDADNALWLQDSFSGASGDLYKAAYDLPDDEDNRAFAELTYLGPSDSDYLLHYNKKTNHKGLTAGDYSSIREFTYGLNHTDEPDMPDWFHTHVEVEQLLSYLVITNFISHWDGYPHRPKNYWIYQDSLSLKWTLLPWDLDATFQTDTFGLNPMGTTASVFFQFDGPEPYMHEPDEGQERPLVRRMMKHPEFRDAYIARYEELMATILDPAYLHDRVTRLTALVERYAGSEDMTHFNNRNATIDQFITERWSNVDGQLSGL